MRRNGYNDSQLSTIQERLQRASDARAQEATGGEIHTGFRRGSVRFASPSLTLFEP